MTNRENAGALGLPERLPTRAFATVCLCRLGRLEHPITIGMLVVRPASSVGVRWVVSSGTKLQVRPAALPLTLVDLALAVLLTPGLNAGSSASPGNRCSKINSSRTIMHRPKARQDRAQADESIAQSTSIRRDRTTPPRGTIDHRPTPLE
jgi:hypothetical protein